MKNIWKIISYTRHFWPWYLFMGVFIVITSLLSLVTPFLLKAIIDVVVAQIQGGFVDLNKIWLYLGFIIAADIFATILISISTTVGDILSTKLQSYLSLQFYKKLLALDVEFYDNEQIGSVTNKLYRGISSITEFVQSMLNNFLPFLLTAVVTIGVLAQYSLFIALLLFILFPLYILISHSSTVTNSKFEMQKNAISDPAQGRAFESIAGIRTVKSFVAETVEYARFGSARNDIEQINKIQSRTWHTYDFYRRLLLNVVLFIIVVYVVYETIHGRYTLGVMTLLLQLSNQARFPLFAMSYILGQIQRADAGSKDFFDLLGKNIRVVNHPGSSTLLIDYKPKNTSFIECSHVDFSYEHNHQVLCDISFSINRGEKIALVGESGQGKSTLMNLLLRFYEPDNGWITINGQNIHKVTLESLRSKIAVVFQESLLFSDTVIDNIRYGKPSATVDEVIAAAKASNSYDFIIKLPDGFESMIGERGVKLSGGQKQRIAIARAILKDAPIIIMDEATSSLDSKSEVLVQQGLERLMKHRTSIIIAHRLSTIANADRIIVLSHGSIKECGTPKELMAHKNGLYRAMVDLQESLLKASPEEREKALKRFDLVG